MDTVYTTEEVAGLLKAHKNTILRLIKTGKLKAVKLGRTYRIAAATLQTLGVLHQSTNSQ